MEILIIEDDRRMARLLERGLQAEGHRVFVASDGREGLDFAHVRTFDVIILDVLLPVMNGFEVAKRLREEKNQTPIVMLTAKDTSRDTVQGLDAGADDYLTKPFAFEELLARLRAVSRRGPIAREMLLQVSDLTLDPASHEVRRGHREISLTPREFQLLEILLRKVGRVVTRNTLLETVWGSETDVDLNTVDVFVSSIRRKLQVGSPSQLIHTVRGIGFCIREARE
jgi:DNA-binding response OmpR family regulator